MKLLTLFATTIVFLTACAIGLGDVEYQKVTIVLEDPGEDEQMPVYVSIAGEGLGSSPSDDKRELIKRFKPSEPGKYEFLLPKYEF